MHSILNKYPALLIGIGLVLLMVATRSSHFGDAFNLPDASVAIFFLAGVYLRHIGPFLLLCATAVASDYISITHNGVSDFCISTAYAALLPTYVVMWFGGRWCSRHLQTQLGHLFAFALVFFVCTILAFNISSGSFYLWSGYFDPSWAEYSQRIAAYLPAYLKNAFVYAIAAAFTHAAVLAVSRVRHNNGAFK